MAHPNSLNERHPPTRNSSSSSGQPRIPEQAILPTSLNSTSTPGDPSVLREPVKQGPKQLHDLSRLPLVLQYHVSPYPAHANAHRGCVFHSAWMFPPSNPPPIAKRCMFVSGSPKKLFYPGFSFDHGNMKDQAQVIGAAHQHSAVGVGWAQGMDGCRPERKKPQCKQGQEPAKLFMHDPR